MESHKVVDEYLTELLGEENTAARQFIDTFLKKWKASSNVLSLTDQDPLLEVYHRPNDEELVLMAAKRPSAKHKRQEGNTSQQPQAQRRNVQFSCIAVILHFLVANQVSNHPVSSMTSSHNEKHPSTGG